MLVILLQPPCLFNEIFPPPCCQSSMDPWVAHSDPWRFSNVKPRPWTKQGTAGVKPEDFFLGNFGDFSGFPPILFGARFGVFVKMSNLTKKFHCLGGVSSSFQLFRNWFWDVLICFTLWVFPKIGVTPKRDNLSWKTLFKWMIWGCHYFSETSLST